MKNLILLFLISISVYPHEVTLRNFSGLERDITIADMTVQMPQGVVAVFGSVPDDAHIVSTNGGWDLDLSTVDAPGSSRLVVTVGATNGVEYPFVESHYGPRYSISSALSLVLMLVGFMVAVRHVRLIKNPIREGE